MPLHPLKTTRHIRDNYIRYLKTIKPFQDEWLRKEFARAIEEPDMLVKGPLVEISPPFKTGVGIRGLVEEGVLSPLFQRLCTPDHLPYERPLYQHQITAVRKLVSGRNVVVSTGTGSGKTEAFLLPILDYLLREKEKGTLHKPGVRALLLYPMNALANDQVKRLRGLLGKYPQITFGRYVGETKHKKNEAEDYFEKNYPGEPRVENELLSRAEMQATPPHILLTNYAMLEYLLLRPKDSSLFDGATGQHWKFIVLDEAHVYNGANATEIAMLLRRVQDRVVQSEPGLMQAIATSATLGGGRGDFPAVVDFATKLFCQSFEWVEDNPSRQDVVGAVRVETDALGKTWGSGFPAFYRKLHEFADKQRDSENPIKSQALLERLAEIAGSHQLPEAVIEEAAQFARQHPRQVLPRFLYGLLRGDENLRHIQGELQNNPEFLEEIAPQIFPDIEEDQSTQALIDLVALAILARPNKDDMPLLPARYHVFARALEGAFICLNYAAHQRPGQDPLPSLFLRRHKFCPHCGSRVFELANCTRCGTAYLIGDEKYGENLNEIPGDEFEVEKNLMYLTQNSAVYLSLQAKQMSYYVLETQLSIPDEDEMVASDADIDDTIEDYAELEEFLLCPKCGHIRSTFEHQKCNCRINPIKLSKVDIGRKRTLHRCVSCSTRSSGGVVYRFLTGQDAPVSVLAGALYQHLPPATDDESARYPGEGRKLLNFTDSRQKAAFFAPYFERVHQRNMRRRLIIKTIQEDPDIARGDLRLSDLLPRVLKRAAQAGVFDEKQSPDARERTVAIWLMQEFSPLDRRISLEGLGLLRFRPVRPRN
ncbi:MAG: DEAD/DEAH box helicase, partial [Chloroflexota bacterium]